MQNGHLTHAKLPNPLSHLSLLSWRMHLPNLKPAHLSFASFPYCAITSKVEAVIIITRAK